MVYIGNIRADILLSGVSFADIKAPIIKNGITPAINLVSNDDISINIKPPLVYNFPDFRGYKLVSRLTGDSIYNKPIINKGRPQLTFRGATVHEDMLISKMTNHEQKQLVPYDMEPRGYVAGRVTIKNVTPVIRMLRLYHRSTGKLIDTTWSDNDGNYRFSTPISLITPYYVVCFNESNLDYVSLIHDWIEPDTE